MPHYNADGLTALLLWQDLHPKSAKVLARRNWCEVEELPTVPVPSIKSVNPNKSMTQKTDSMTGILKFSIRVEDPEHMTRDPEVFVVPVPPYTPPKTYEGNSPMLQLQKLLPTPLL